MILKHLNQPVGFLGAAGSWHPQEDDPFARMPLEKRKLGKVLVVRHQQSALLVSEIKNPRIRRAGSPLGDGEDVVPGVTQRCDDWVLQALVGEKPHQAVRIRGRISSVPMACLA